MRPSFAITGLALLLAGCGSSDEPPVSFPRQVDPDGSYVHRPTGMIFPVQLDDISRTGIVEYDDGPKEIGVAYDHGDGDPDASFIIHVQPAPSSSADPAARDAACKNLYAQLKGQMIGGHPDAQLLEETEIPAPAASYQGHGYRIAYILRATFDGYEQQVKTEADLYCYVAGTWAITYRTTAPTDSDYGDALRRLVSAIPWPKPKG